MDRADEIYMLCMSEPTSGGLSHKQIATKYSANDLTEEIKRRVRDGCPVGRLVVFRVIPFDLEMGVTFKEEE